MPAHMLPKPRKGAATAMRRARTRLAHARERAAKDAAKARDGWTCRRCDKLLQAPKRSMGDIPAWLEVGSGEAAEAAHIADKGMGGDPTGLRSWKASDYVTLCHACHQGPRSIHSGHVVIVAGRKGGDGRVKFVDGTPGKLLHIRVESAE